MKEFTDEHLAYVFPKEPADALRAAIKACPAAVECGALMAPIDLTDEQADDLVVRMLRAIANHGREISPHKEGKC